MATRSGQREIPAPAELASVERMHYARTGPPYSRRYRAGHSKRRGVPSVLHYPI